jgi:phosphoglycolate phosphatase
MTYNILVFWNIDLTLVDVARVTRAAYADAFAKVAGRPLVQLPQMAGRTEPEVFFEALALNNADMSEKAELLLEPFSRELARAMQQRRDDLTTQGHLLPGAADALKAIHEHKSTVQSVLTGTSKPNAILKLTAFSLDEYVDFEVGGYGDEVFPKGTLLQVARQRAQDKYQTVFDEQNTVYIGDSTRDVAAAEVGGARPLAVATGRSTVTELRDALSQAGLADAILPDLSDTAALLRRLYAG